VTWAELRDWLERTPDAVLTGVTLHPDDVATLRKSMPEIPDRLSALGCAFAISGPGLKIYESPHIPRGQCVPVIRRTTTAPSVVDHITARVVIKGPAKGEPS